jgi:DNA-binding transcriptional regulator YdaS (Cro superfamily)
MQLSAFLNRERGLGATTAAACGLAPAFLSQIANGVRPAPAERCADIERATGFLVRRWDLRPADWHRIWPELVGQPGAPAVPAAETPEVRDAA